MKRTLTKSVPFLAACALLLALAGCGGSDSSSGESSSGLAERPSAERPIADEVAGFERALREESCEAFQPYLFSTLRRRPPGAAATPTECKEDGDLVVIYARRLLHPISNSAEYGTGALIEAPEAGGEKNYTFWILDRDGRFRFINFEGVFDRQIGTEFVHRAETERVAESFVSAVARHDCRTLLKDLQETSRLVVEQPGPRATCRAVLGDGHLAAAIHPTPKPRIDVMGGTQDFAFIGIQTTAAYFTILLGESSYGGMRVIDVLPSTPLEQQSPQASS